MNKIRKAGLLIVTLVIPALIFTFLKFFATNHYNLPYYHALRDVRGNVLISNGDTIFYKPDINGLISIDGVILTGDLFMNNVTVVSTLPSIYDEETRQEYNQLERVYGLKQTIPYLNLITAAGHWPQAEGGYPKVMGTNGWKVGVFSGENEASAFYKTLRLETKIPKAKSNCIENKLVLIDQGGYIRGYYNGSDVEEIDRLMAEIKILDYEKRN